MNRSRLVCGLLLFGCVLLSAATFVRADNWPSWRGPENNGICQETGLPKEWGEKKNIAWKLPLPGKGGSTPVVWGSNIFLTSAEGKDLVLLCVGTDGQIKWKQKLGTANRTDIRGGEANEASPSPSTDGKHVFVFTGSGDFACFDFEGNEIWKFNAQQRYGKFQIQHGMHTTPLLNGDRLYLTLLHARGHWVIALDKATGTEVWKVDRPTDAEGECKEAYTSPCLWQEGGETHLIVLGNDYLTAHRLSDGGEAWRLHDFNPASRYAYNFRIIASPVAAPGLLVAPSMRAGPVIAIKPGANGRIEAGSAFEAWRLAKSPDVPSPLIHDGLVYLCRENGELMCLDAKTGQLQYQKSLHRAIYRASPVFADGKIYIAARDGSFSVIKAGRQFELLANNTLQDDFSASPAIANGRIYLRGFRNLYAIELGK